MTGFIDTVGPSLGDILKPLVGVYVGYLLSRFQEQRKQRQMDRDGGNVAVVATGTACMDASMALLAVLSSGKVGERDPVWLESRHSLLRLEAKIALALHEDIDSGVQVQLQEIRDLIWNVLPAVDSLGINPEEFTDKDKKELNRAWFRLEADGRFLLASVSEDSKSSYSVEKGHDEPRSSGIDGVPDGYARAYTHRKKRKRR